MDVEPESDHGCVLTTRFLRDLKDKCLTKPGNPHFWEKIQEVGRGLSLISQHEAKKLGGVSEVTGDEAEEVSPFHIFLSSKMQILINHFFKKLF